MPFRLAGSRLNGGANTVPDSGRLGTLATVPNTTTVTPSGNPVIDTGTTDGGIGPTSGGGFGTPSRRPARNGGGTFIDGPTVLTEFATGLIPVPGGIITETVANLGTPGSGPATQPETQSPPPGTSDEGDANEPGGAFGRLADAFVAALGGQASAPEDTSPYVVVDPNQGASSGSTMNMKTLLILAGVGVAGWWLWKKYGKAAVANAAS